MERTRAFLLAGAVAAGIGFTNSAIAASIGVNFIGGNNGSASVTGTAGFVPQGNWNNEDGNTQATGQPLLLDNGSASGATVTWNSSNLWDQAEPPLTRMPT